VPSGSDISLLHLHVQAGDTAPYRRHTYRLQEIHVPEKGGRRHGHDIGPEQPLLEYPMDFLFTEDGYASPNASAGLEVHVAFPNSLDKKPRWGPRVMTAKNPN